MDPEPHARPDIRPGARPGLARRADTFDILVETTAGARAAGVTTARVTGLVLNGARMITPRLSYGALVLLARLCEFVFDADRWASGRLMVTPGNARLARCLGTSERTIRRWLQELERERWIVRVYNQANRRSDLAGLDLRPVAGRLETLRQAEAALTAELDAERRPRVDTPAMAAAADAARQTPAEESQEEDHTVRQGGQLCPPEYSTETPKGINLVQAPGYPQAETADDRDLARNMVEVSPTLQRVLTGDELLALDGTDAARALAPLARAISWQVRRMGLPGTAWAEGLRAHGIAALAAAVIALERQGIRNRAGYLRAMLQKTALRHTVRHSLDALAAKRCPS